MAANHSPVFGPRSHMRISVLPPLFSRTHPRPSTRWLVIRSVSGGLPAMQTTHASQT
jgi:hypothetical protein